jgi:MFS family permease
MHQVVSERAERAPAGSAARRPFGVVLAVCSGVGLATLNATIVNIALPQIGHGMHAGLTGLQWVANSYMVVYAALLLPAGSLAARLGRRRLFLAGTALLTGWRSVFVAVAAAGLATLVIAWTRISPARHGGAAAAAWQDVAGAVLATACLAALSYALIEGQDQGWSSRGVVTAFAVAAGALAAFAVVERRRSRVGAATLMPPGVWRIPKFTAANAGGVVYGVALFGILFYLSLFLQQVQGRSALASGLVFLPLSGAMAVTGPFAGRLTARYGQRAVLTAGTLIAAAGAVSLAAISAGDDIAWLSWRLLITGAGMGLMAAPLSSAIISALPERAAGFASAMYNSSRQVGGVLGIAALGAIVAAGRAAPGTPAAVFVHGLRLAMLAAGLALLASALISAVWLRDGRR